MRLNGRFGRFGGCFVPEILVPALEQLEGAFLDAEQDASFRAELDELLATYAGRPTPLTRCRNLGGKIYLKREDLLHGGAHKTNQVLGQALLAKRMGKRRLIAETGAGQHGVATAIVGALFGFETQIYMGAEDVEILAPAVRSQLIDEMLELRKTYKKLYFPQVLADGYRKPPTSPADCIFARTTLNYTADLKSKVTPCQFGGTPDCSQCGCMASGGLNAIGDYKVLNLIPVRTIYNASDRIGKLIVRN
jgi:hypothetical protein